MAQRCGDYRWGPKESAQSRALPATPQGLKTRPGPVLSILAAGGWARGSALILAAETPYTPSPRASATVQAPPVFPSGAWPMEVAHSDGYESFQQFVASPSVSDPSVSSQSGGKRERRMWSPPRCSLGRGAAH